MSLVIDGKKFPEGITPLTAYLYLFGQGKGFSPEKRFEYLKKAIDLAFNCEGSIRRVIWNPWTERMLKACIGNWDQKRFAGLAGCSSSGKSDTVALYGLMEYWARPADTYFLVMSTTKQAARMRIWKSVTQFWGQAVRKGCPGKLVDSIGEIKGVNALGAVSGNSGIKLLAAGKQDAAETCDTLLGVKNKNVVIGADENNTLGDGILKTAYENMTSNERLNFIGMANPDKLTDPFADLCEPKNGWKSVNLGDDEWRTKYGMCYRFNAEESPRILEANDELYWQPDKAYCERIAENRGGKRSRGYYRFVLAFWCPDGAENSVYSETEMMQGGALTEAEPRWDHEPIVVTGLDPSFSRNGDRSQACFGKVGKVNGVDHFHVCYETLISEDASDKTTPLTHQIVYGWVEVCKEWGVLPTRAAMDNTGSGISFGHVVDKEWSPAVQKVNFQGSPSDQKVKFRMEECEYFNKNSELWIQPKEFIRSGQITGISKELMEEMVEREFHGKETRKLRVESKEDVKKRMKKSPDRADAFLLAFEKAVTMGLMRSEEVKEVTQMANNGWGKTRAITQLKNPLGKRMRIKR